MSIPSLDFLPGQLSAELERLQGEVPWDAPDSSYLDKIYLRAEPDQNDWAHFHVYGYCGVYFWSACTPSGMHRAPRAGPFKSAKSAYLAAEAHRYEEDE
jgi:hypothetical protein